MIVANVTPVDFLNTFGEFRNPSWSGWKGHLARLTEDVRECFVVAGRGSGKSRIAAALACYYATQRIYLVVPGERIYIGVIAPDRKQATVTLNYVRGLLQSVPDLAALIESETSDSIDLIGGTTIEVVTATVSAPRGRAYGLVVLEEAAFLPTDQSANPDVELLRAVRPALARVPGSLLCVISSPYARRGVLFDAWKRYHDVSVADVLFVQAATLDLNPTFDRRAIDKAYEEDPIAAAAEYGGLFRSDVESFLSREALDACVVPGRLELPRCPGIIYRCFLDFAGGSGGDSATLAIAHTERRPDGQSVHVLDAIREVRPPFSPDAVCQEFAAVIKAYGCYRATSDRWGGQFPVEAMRKLGIHVEASVKPKSDLYAELLPLVNSGRVELLDLSRFLAQLGSLERRVARGGRDSIDHGPGAHDDVANAVAGVIVMGDLQDQVRVRCFAD